MQKYVTESHMSDPAQHAHIRTIPAPDTHRNSWRDRDKEKEERRSAPRGLADEGASSRSRVQAPATKINTASTQPDTFASKLRGPPAEPENRPSSAAPPHQPVTIQKRPPPLTLVSNGMAPIMSPPPPVTSPDPAAPKPSKVVFAPRSIRSSAGETVNVSHLMREYGLQATPAPQSVVDETDNSTTQEEVKNPGGFKTHRPQNSATTRSLNRMLERVEKSAATGGTWSPSAAIMTMENKPGIADKYDAGSAGLSRPIDRLSYFPNSTVSSPPGLLQSPPREQRVPLSLVEDFRRIQLQQPPPVDMSGRRGGISFPTAFSPNEHTFMFVGPKTIGAGDIPQQTIHEKVEVSEDEFRHYLRQFENPRRMNSDRFQNPPELLTERQIRAIEDERLYKINTRKSLIHRLETLDMANRGRDFEVKSDARVHIEEYTYNQQADGLNRIDGTGPWGTHNLDDVRTSRVRGVLDVDALNPPHRMYIEGNVRDRNYRAKTNEYYDTGKVGVRILSDEEKARLVEFESQERDLVTNPMLLPYNYAPDIPQNLQVQDVMSDVFNNLMEYYPNPMLPRNNGPSTNYFERVPFRDLGLSRPELFYADNKIPNAPAKRDPREEVRWLRDSYLKVMNGKVVPPYAQFPPGMPRYLPTGDLRKEVDIETVADRQQSMGPFPPGLSPTGTANGMKFGDIKAPFGSAVLI